MESQLAPETPDSTGSSMAAVADSHHIGFPKELMAVPSFVKGLLNPQVGPIIEYAEPAPKSGSTSAIVRLTCQYVCTITAFNACEGISFPGTALAQRSSRAGKDVITRFPKNEISDALKENLTKQRMTHLTEIQMVLISTMMGDDSDILPSNHVIVLSPPGTGKTIAYLIAGIQILLPPEQTGGVKLPTMPKKKGLPRCAYPKMLILAHTREVAIQTYITATRQAKNTGIEVRVVYGGCDIRIQRRMFSHGCDILIATPGRLLHLLRDKAANLQDLQYAVLANAHALLSPGLNDDMNNVAASIPPHTAYWVFTSAIMTGKDQDKLNQDYFKGQEPVYLRSEYANDEANGLPQNVRVAYDCSTTGRPSKLYGMIKSNPDDTFLVLCRTKAAVDKLEQMIHDNCGNIVVGTHSDRTQLQREQLMTSFRNGKKRIMLATYSLLGRGISLPGTIHLVIFALPNTAEELLSAVGCVGYFGQELKATVFYNPNKQEELDILKAVGADLP